MFISGKILNRIRARKPFISSFILFQVLALTNLHVYQAHYLTNLSTFMEETDC